MKKFLIPTTLAPDTIAAVNAAIYQSKNNDCEIVFLFVCDSPDTYSTSQFLREMRMQMSANQENILENCRSLIEGTANCKLKIHNQCGLSTLIFKGITELYAIDLIIFPNSYQKESKKINKYLIQLATKQKCPILHLNVDHNAETCSKALFIKENNGKITLESVQNFLNDNFPLEIVSQTTHQSGHYEDAILYINEAISKYKIDMLVQTRMNQKVKFKKNKSEDLNQKLGLPVLSLYEELV